MNDLRIAIAVEDAGLRKLVYSLLPGVHPAHLWGAYDHARIDAIENLLIASRNGLIDLIIIDWSFQFKRGPGNTPVEVPPHNRIGELVATNLPIVALMPRHPRRAEFELEVRW